MTAAMPGEGAEKGGGLARCGLARLRLGRVVDGLGNLRMRLLRSFSHLASLLVLGALLAGCAGSGPTGRDLLTAGEARDTNFSLVEINEFTIGTIANWHRPSLSAVFGDYRRPGIHKIGVGDSVQINIWEAGAGGIFSASAAELQQPASRAAQIPEQVVSREGTVNVPYAGRIRVAGKTPSEVEEQIVKRLQGKSAQPQVLVTLAKSFHNTVTVTGDVTAGARVALNGAGDRILDVITQAGGTRAPLYETYITLTRDGQSHNVAMQTLLANAKENIYVRPGDIITVIRATQSFTAVGATGRQAHIGFDANGLTLEEALGKAGGLLDERADPRGVFVLRFEPSALAQSYPNAKPHLIAGGVVPVAYHLDMRSPVSLFLARRFAIRDKDVLYVSNAPISDIEKVLRVFGTLTSPAVSTYTTLKAVQ